MNESNRQLPAANYASAQHIQTQSQSQPLNNNYSGPNSVDSWMHSSQNTGQQLPYGVMPNQNEFDSLKPNFHVGNGPPNFIHHSFASQQPYLNNKYGAEFNQSHFNSNLYNSSMYSNNYVSKVDGKPSVNSEVISDAQMDECSDGNTAEGLTARLLDKNSDSGQPGSPGSSQDGSGGVGYRPWEQDGQIAQEQPNAQQIHPTRPSSAQSDKLSTTPDMPSRRSGRSPSAQHYSDNHIERLNNQGTEKYQTLTPVPPIPPISAPGFNHGLYGQPPSVGYANTIGPTPFMPNQSVLSFPGGYQTPDGKQVKIEPDSSTPDVRAAIENSFQVPSVSSTTSRQTLAGMPPSITPSSVPPQHQQPNQQVVTLHHNNNQPSDQWDTSNQVSVTPNAGQTQTPAEGEKVTKKKRKRCGECPGCLKKDNCGECGPCKSVRSHQICKMRKCDQLKTKKEKVREVVYFFF